MISADGLSLGFGLVGRLSGPLFTKELRVAGRRRRSYALRCAYVVFLMFYIGAVWVNVVRFRGTGAFQQARMELAAKVITRNIIWFQFIAAQIVALITVSAAISDEVYSRTLDVLMTTPMSESQLVMGKLTSRLFQILLLVATSLPLLATVRVLGGVPWGYLCLGLGITLVTVIFVASVGMYFSALCRRAYVVVIAGTLAVGCILGLLPFLGFLALEGARLDDQVYSILSYLSPYVLLLRCMDYMVSPVGGRAVPVLSIVSCCSFLLLGAGCLLRASIRSVRRVALRRLMGQKTFLDYLHPGYWLKWPGGRRSTGRDRAIRRVVGPPMIWKEMICSLSRRQKLAAAWIIGIEVFLVIVAYLLPVIMGIIGYGETHLLFIWIFMALGTLFTLTVSATMISAEREAQTWPLLLVSPLRDRDLVLGKCAGVLRRCVPIWLPLLTYIVAFTLARCFHPLAIVEITLVVVSTLVFLSGTGFYLGARFRRTTDAVTANLILAILLWCILPIFAYLGAGILDHHWHLGEFMSLIPFGQATLMAVIMMDGAGDRVHFFGHTFGPAEVAVLTLVCTLAYGLVARVFLWRAVRAFRQHPL